MTEEQLNEIGEKLAEWSRHHRKTIKINGKPINRAGPTAQVLSLEQTPDGPRKTCRPRTPIIWQTGLARDENNRILRENLRRIIQQSDCNAEVLLAYVSKLNDTDWLKQLTAEKLAGELNCLGQFNFSPVKNG